MLDRRIILHATFVLLLPVLVAAFGWSVWTALLIVVLALVLDGIYQIIGRFTTSKGLAA